MAQPSTPPQKACLSAATAASDAAPATSAATDAATAATLPAAGAASNTDAASATATTSGASSAVRPAAGTGGAHPDRDHPTGRGPGGAAAAAGSNRPATSAPTAAAASAARPASGADSSEADSSGADSTEESATDQPDAARRLERNRRWLQARAASRDTAERLAWRNALVAGNLALVRSIAARESRGDELPFDDLVQVGCLGLIRALEAFDPARGTRLSSFAVPYIRGAIRREYRDRRAMVRIPRPLWELRQRACRLQEQQSRAGAPELGLQALARQLGCGIVPLAEAIGLEAHSRVWSLDAPRPGRQGDGGDGSPWLEQLADPSSLARPSESNSDSESPGRVENGLCHWLQRRLACLSQAERVLVEGRINQNRTWVDLGHELGLPARQAQRRCHALLTRLRQEAEACLQSDGATARASSAASSV